MQRIRRDGILHKKQVWIIKIQFQLLRSESQNFPSLLMESILGKLCDSLRIIWNRITGKNKFSDTVFFWKFKNIMKIFVGKYKHICISSRQDLWDVCWCKKFSFGKQQQIRFFLKGNNFPKGKSSHVELPWEELMGRCFEIWSIL